MKQVWNFGGGTQSCAIAVLIVRGILPKPDLAVIADTGREVSTTWEYLEKFIQPMLDTIGLKINRIPASELGYGGIEFMQSGAPIIPAFTTENGRVSKLSAFCNRWWKQDAIKRWLANEKGLTRSHYRTWIGFSLDEQRRFFRMMEGEEYKAGLLWFPLVEMRMRRSDAIKTVEAMGLPTPPRSRCWMCPNQQDSEWGELKHKLPTDFQKAIAFQKELSKSDPHAWLHKTCQPIEMVDFEAQAEFETACDSGHCFL